MNHVNTYVDWVAFEFLKCELCLPNKSLFCSIRVQDDSHAQDPPPWEVGEVHKHMYSISNSSPA